MTAFSEMLDNTHSVATQALQVWLTKGLRDLGWTPRRTRSCRRTTSPWPPSRP